MVKKCILIYIASLLLFVLEAPVRGVTITEELSGPMLSMLVGPVLYCLLTFCLLKKCHFSLSVIYILLLILGGKLTLDILVRVFNFQDSLVSLFDSIGQVFGILFGYLFYQSSIKKRRWVLSIVFLCLLVTMTFVIHPFWRNWLYHRIPNKEMEGWQFERKDGGFIEFDSLRTEYIVLDFWTAQCGICREKFPLVQAFYDKYKECPTLTKSSVFVKYKCESNEKGVSIIYFLNYDLPVWSIAKDNDILKNSHVVRYPTVLILNKDRRIIFNGGIEDAEKRMEKLLQK